MKPVNLLPSRHRPRGPSGERQGAPYVVLGVLGALLLGVLGYVLSANQVTSRKAEAVHLGDEARRAEVRADSLKAYARFADIKSTRESSVKSLAQSRIDWERTMRELARVLPANVRLMTVDAAAATTADSAASGSSGSTAPQGQQSSSSSPAAGGTTPAQGPTVTLAGCARSQRDVATTLVRLRQLSGTSDVTLQGSTSSDESGSSAAAAAPPQGAAGGEGSCERYKFELTVTFKPGWAAEASQEKVPASLGGGS